jgi:TRAP-type C4-dicarboxylate transport system permease small subunit
VNTLEPASVRPGPVGRALYRVSVVVAAVGGLSLLGIMLLTVASVIGRELFDSPVPGDFELVEIWCAVAVFAFLPYCQLVRGNVVVDLFTESASLRTRATLELIGNAMFTVIAAVLTWRMVLGGIDLATYHEETMVLRVPLWWGFVPGVLATALLTVVCAYTSWRSAAEYIAGRRIDAQG